MWNWSDAQADLIRDTLILAEIGPSTRLVKLGRWAALPAERSTELSASNSFEWMARNHDPQSTSPWQSLIATGGCREI